MWFVFRAKPEKQTTFSFLRAKRARGLSKPTFGELLKFPERTH
ncbi:MAG: hypothetical protein U5L45_21120 [Saprospiraceae bacterium]|nr:hypothetical protein [Saprospiraceae bacterium]